MVYGVAAPPIVKKSAGRSRRDTGFVGNSPHGCCYRRRPALEGNSKWER